LDPSFADASGSRWWIGRLRHLIERTSLRIVADNLLVLEALPYHSDKFKGAHGIPSQNYTQHLLGEARRRSALLIFVRGPWMKRDPGLANYPRLLETNTPQVAHLSPRNLGQEHFQQVVEALT